MSGFFIITILLTIYYIPPMCQALFQTVRTFSHCNPYNFVRVTKLSPREDY